MALKLGSFVPLGYLQGRGGARILNVRSVEEYNCSLWVGSGRLYRFSIKDCMRSADYHTPGRHMLCAASPGCREICFPPSHKRELSWVAVLPQPEDDSGCTCAEGLRLHDS